MGHRSAIEADAVLLDEDLTLSYRQIDIPKLQGDDLLLAPIRVGICGSDLHVRSSGDWVEHWPAVLGHEVLARVVDSAAEAVPIGSKVIIDSRLPCLSCTGCKRSSRYCERLRWVGEARYGGLATRMSFPSNSVIRVPEELPAAVAVLAEPLAVALASVEPVLRQISGRSARVLILGFGPVGGLCAAALRARGFSGTLAVSELNQKRMELTRHVGAIGTHTGSGELYDAVIDAAGYPGSLQDAVSSVVNGGIVSVVALAHGTAQVDAQMIVEKSVTIVGSNGFDEQHLDAAVQLLVSHTEGFGWLVDEKSPTLSELPDLWHPGELLGTMKTTVLITEY